MTRQRLFRHEDRLLVFQLKARLDDDHIDAELRNEFAAGAAGDLSPFDCWPEIWVEEADVERAEQLIEQTLNQPVAASWQCKNCGEMNEGQFELCWQCQQPKIPV